jgi:hypothetical protein
VNRRPIFALVFAVIGIALAGSWGTAFAKPKNSIMPKVPAVSDKPASGSSDQRRMIGILDVRVEGISDEMKAQFEKHLTTQVTSDHYWLASPAQMRERMKLSTKWTEGCVIGVCLSEVRTQTNAELVVLAALTGSGTSFGYVVTLVRTDIGRVLSQKAERCDVCTAAEVMQLATLAVIELINAAPDPLPDISGDQGAAVDLAVGQVKRSLQDAQRTTRRGGIVLTVVGAVAAGVGAALYYTQDKPMYAVGITAGGAGLLASGVIVLTF